MYRKVSQDWFKHLDFMILDFICLHISFILAYFARNGFQNPYGDSLYRNTVVVISVIDILVLIFFDTMKNVLKRGYYRELIATIVHIAYVEVLTTFYLFTMQTGQMYSRFTLFSMGIIYLALTYTVRTGYKLYLRTKMISGGNRSLLIVTEKKRMNIVVDNIRNHNYERFTIIGIAVLDEDMYGQTIEGIDIIANRDNFRDIVKTAWIDEVFLDISQNDPDLDVLVNRLNQMGIVVHTKLAQTSNIIGEKQFVERIGNYTVLTTSMNYASARQLFMKRALDILGGLVGCLITAILYVFLAPIIYIKSPGPIFFKQTRIGKNGKKFNMYKFRSMYLDAEERKKELMEENRVQDGLMFKLDFDPRIIGCRKRADGIIKKGIGNFIRDLSLDEFPQFWNVLKGDMSLVGTRPPTIDEWECYDSHHRARMAAKPGITGLWQVSGRSNVTDFERVVRLDTKYISEWSIGLDIKILLKTFAVVLRKEGAM